jgi:hypothetical protein
MTDLQKWLNKPYGEMTVSEIDTRNFAALAALRAVVELHQPIPEFPGEAPCKDCEWIWPCPTIRRIEKEVLK